MKTRISLLSAAVMAVTLAACNQSPEPAKKAELDLSQKEQQASYLMGYEMARQMQRDGVVPNADALAQGVRDALAAAPAKVSDETAQSAVDTATRSYVSVREQTIARKAMEDNMQVGKDFLAQNAQKEGVVTTESGLQYKVLTEGTGASPAATDVVEVHYHGTLIDGSVFDSSVDRNKKISFPLNRVIPGWTEGLQLMKEGGKYTFYIPSELAYGARSPSPAIGPHSTLIFDVELFRVNPESESGQ